MLNLSIVVTTHNSLEWLDQLCSIIRSLSVDNEVIVDDGSTDGTYERLLELKSSSPISLLSTKGKRAFPFPEILDQYCNIRIYYILGP